MRIQFQCDQIDRAGAPVLQITGTTYSSSSWSYLLSRVTVGVSVGDGMMDGVKVGVLVGVPVLVGLGGMVGVEVGVFEGGMN
jgi:hypothetical protein